MQPEGATNIPGGLASGRRVLSEKPPFTESKASGLKDSVEASILVTDGENTCYPTYTNGSAFEVGNFNLDGKSVFGTYGYGMNWTKDAVPVEQIGHMLTPRRPSRNLRKRPTITVL